MIFYLLLPFLGLILIVVQTMISDLFFFGKIGLEMSLIMAIYAGLRFDILRGGLLCLFLGFLLDCISGSISGFYTLIYLLVFFVSMIVSQRIVPDKIIFLGVFSALCVLLEALLILFLHPLIYEGEIFRHVLNTLIPQALIIGVISPFLFHAFRRFEVFLDVKNAKQVE